MALLGTQSLDYWNQSVNERVLNNELKKLDADGKRQLAEAKGQRMWKGHGRSQAKRRAVV